MNNETLRVNMNNDVAPCIFGSELSERFRERDSGTSSSTSSPSSSSSLLSRRRAGFLWAVDDASGAALEIVVGFGGFVSFNSFWSRFCVTLTDRLVQFSGTKAKTCTNQKNVLRLPGY